jgi:hypothetical protein
MVCLKWLAGRRGSLVQVSLVWAGMRHATTAANRGSDSATSGQWARSGWRLPRTVHTVGSDRRGITGGPLAGRGWNRAVLPQQEAGEAATIGGTGWPDAWATRCGREEWAREATRVTSWRKSGSGGGSNPINKEMFLNFWLIFFQCSEMKINLGK